MAEAAIRILENPRRAMQRLGFLKLIVHRASLTFTSNTQALAGSLREAITTRVTIPHTPVVERYLKGVGLDKDAYLRGRSQSQARDAVSVELQDAYLANESIPSQRGRLAIDDDFLRFPQYAVSLGLLRSGSFSPLVRGQTFLRLITAREIDAFKSYVPSSNPLLLTETQVVFLLFCLLEKDFDVMPHLAAGFLALPAPFTDSQAGDLLPQILKRVVARLKPRTVAAKDVARLRQLSETAWAIEQRKGGRFGKTVREQTITPRLEALVEMRILSKPDPLSYEYEATARGRQFLETLGAAGTDSPFVQSRFVGSAVQLIAMQSAELCADDQILRFCYKAWEELASGLGYAPITDTVLLGSIRALEVGDGYFEYTTALDAIKDAQHLSPPLVRLNVDRWGQVTVVKFLRTP